MSIKNENMMDIFSKSRHIFSIISLLFLENQILETISLFPPKAKL